MAPVEHVVADAGAFLRDAALQDIGKNIYTVREVVSEIRDRATRRRLAVLPYALRFREPLAEYVRLGECRDAADGAQGTQWYSVPLPASRRPWMRFPHCPRPQIQEPRPVTFPRFLRVMV
ncbi:PREDICTED: RNA-binding protein NOB1-like, partial [Chinchilla lanigera]|uniref:RNA-binding protein NOB1-like n=1 Tax=Chinchilla lanigera TaxID=34839 RepID=UPI00038ED3A6